MKRRLPLLALCSILAISCSSSDPESPGDDAQSETSRVARPLEPADMPGIDKLHTVSGLYLAGQPDESGFASAKERGIKTVIDLRHEDETEFDEKELVEELGMAYVPVPWNGEDQLTDEVFDRARELLGSADKPILLHCKSANRVGAVWLPYRVLEDGVAVEEAVEEAKAVGMKSAGYEKKARDYIERKSS